MNPLAAIYHPGGSDPYGYPVSVIHFQTTWSDETGAVTEVVCVATDGSIRVFDAQLVQVVDRAVAEAIVAATAAAEKQRQQFGTIPPR
jgi:hypothetical protein